jgi:hypothetical protein
MIRLAHLYCAITENLLLRLKTRCFGGGRKSRNDFSRSYRLKREGRRKWRLRRAYGCRARKLPTSTGVRAEGHSPRYKAYVIIQDCIKHQNLIAGGKSVDRKLMQTCAALVKQEARSTRADSTSTRARQLLRAKIPSGPNPAKRAEAGQLRRAEEWDQCWRCQKEGLATFLSLHARRRAPQVHLLSQEIWETIAPRLEKSNLHFWSPKQSLNSN